MSIIVVKPQDICITEKTKSMNPAPVIEEDTTTGMKQICKKNY